MQHERLGSRSGSIERTRPAWLAIVLSTASAAALSACSVDPAANPAYHSPKCSKAELVDGYCLTSSGGGGVGLGGNGASGSGGTAGSGEGIDEGDACTSEGGTVPCYTGGSDTDSVGVCKSGVRVCREKKWGSCNGQVQPSDELCNGLDDDCDGKTDETGSLGACDVSGQLAGTACMAGELRCQNTQAVCVQTVIASAETCNGKDDDCDGATDENTTVQCYDADKGCKPDGKGGFTCNGSCRPGISVCNDGKPSSSCAGQELPKSKETCGASLAVDDNCDGNIDEGCSCTGSASQPCYDGPAVTAGVGECQAGSQKCNGATFGECTGSKPPSRELCDGKDNDCNGMIDDVPGTGDPCSVPNKQGPCKPGTLACDGNEQVCVSLVEASKEVCDGLDNDCDDVADNGFDFASDEAHCGDCSTTCKNTQTCCGGGCTDVKTDAKNCGACGTICGEGLNCCDGQCVDQKSDDSNCGKCGMNCGLKAACHCSGGACRGTLGLCL